MFLDLRNNLKGSGPSLYECSISYSTLKRSFAPRILTTASASIQIWFDPFAGNPEPRLSTRQAKAAAMGNENYVTSKIPRTSATAVRGDCLRVEPAVVVSTRKLQRPSKFIRSANCCLVSILIGE
jgi:hypothetical protein